MSYSGIFYSRENKHTRATHICANRPQKSSGEAREQSHPRAWLASPIHPKSGSRPSALFGDVDAGSNGTRCRGSSDRETGKGPAVPSACPLAPARGSPMPPGHGASGWNPSPMRHAHSTRPRLDKKPTPRSAKSLSRGLWLSPAALHCSLALLPASPPNRHSAPQGPFTGILTPRSIPVASLAHPQLEGPPDPTPSFRPSPLLLRDLSGPRASPKHRGPGASLLPACSSPAAHTFSDLSQVTEEVSPPPGSPLGSPTQISQGPPLLSL